MSDKHPTLFRDWLSGWWQAFVGYPYITHTRFYRTQKEALDAWYRREVTKPDGRSLPPEEYFVR